MANNIYPDLSNDKFDIPYSKALVFISDISNPITDTSTTGRPAEEIVDESIPYEEPFNIDGGFAACVYSVFHEADGGYAAAIYATYEIKSGGNSDGV